MCGNALCFVMPDALPPKNCLGLPALPFEQFDCKPAVLLEAANVLVAVGVRRHALAVHLALRPLADVPVAAHPVVLPRPVPLVVLEHAHIRVAVGEHVLPLAVLGRGTGRGSSIEA